MLNVIEDPSQRDRVLCHALDLARGVLIVSVRVDRGPHAGEAFADGMLTSRLGFQKLYTQAEFRSYIESVSGHPPTMAALGIAYIFKDAACESKYLARASVYRPLLGRRSAIASFESSVLGKEYVALARALARMPGPATFLISMPFVNSSAPHDGFPGS